MNVKLERMTYLKGVQKGLNQLARGQKMPLKLVQKKIVKWAKNARKSASGSN